MRIVRASSLWVACICALAAGCSVSALYDQIHGASKALREGDDAVAEGEYEAGIRSYLRARESLVAARRDGYLILSDDKKIASIDRKMLECERLAEEDGYTRVGTRYMHGDELGGALAGELRRMLAANAGGPGAPSRVVPDELEASCVAGPDGRYDVRLAVTVREAEDEAEFSQDAWALVRFLMEGGWGYGFSFTVAPRFGTRSYMGTVSEWGRSEREGAENRFIGLGGRIDRIEVVVERGRQRQDPGDGYGARGFRSLEAVGPYWRREPYRSYVMTRRDAERLNWTEAGKIPDATLYGLTRVAPGSGTMPGATAAVEIQ